MGDPQKSTISLARSSTTAPNPKRKVTYRPRRLLFFQGRNVAAGRSPNSIAAPNPKRKVTYRPGRLLFFQGRNVAAGPAREKVLDQARNVAAGPARPGLPRLNASPCFSPTPSAWPPCAHTRTRNRTHTHTHTHANTQAHGTRANANS